MLDIDDLLRFKSPEARRRHFMASDRFAVVVAYLEGLIEGAPHVIAGLREYLLLEIGRESPLGWPGLILQAAGFEDSVRVQLQRGAGSDEDNQRAIVAVFDYLARYRQALKNDGLDDILARCEQTKRPRTT